MRVLLPQPSANANLVEMYARDVPPPGGRRFLRVNMISSLDGAVAVAGRSGGLGGPGDKLLFHILRSMADVVLVGASTVRVERYGPPHVSPEVQLARQAKGQSAVPRLAIVTQSLNLDWSARLFKEAVPKPIIIAPGNSPAAALAQAREVADVLTAGVGGVDLAGAVNALAAQGLSHVLCEGGPTLNTSLAAARTIDELCLTLSPQLAGSVGGVLLGGWLGSAGLWMARTDANGERTFRSQPLVNLLKLKLVHVLEEDGYLFLRLSTAPSDG